MVTNTPITHAMIFAAGLGTRLKPFTNHHPKALAMVNGKTLLQRNIEYLQQFGIYNVVVNVHHFANQIIDTIHANNGWGSTINISNEVDEVLETGGGLKKAEPFFAATKNFVVLNVDMLTTLNLTKIIQQHIATNACATLAVTQRTTSRYFLFNNKNILCGWKNIKTNQEIIVQPQPNLQQLAFSGIHVINNSLFRLITQQGKFSMVDVYLNIAQNNIVQCYNHTGDVLIDVGKPENIIMAQELFT